LFEGKNIGNICQYSVQKKTKREQIKKEEIKIISNKKNIQIHFSSFLGKKYPKIEK
tara:strand:+ start:423 stop:590 length:168 start_codon:yes stop_codon:yes gene_type:complete